MAKKSSNSGLPGNDIWTIAIDANRSKWIRTGYGVAVYNENGILISIKDVTKSDINLQVFPNPTFTNITIEIPTKGSLFIHNISGQQLLRQQITEPTTTIDVNTLQSGIYVVKIVGEKGVQVGKFIKQ